MNTAELVVYRVLSFSILINFSKRDVMKMQLLFKHDDNYYKAEYEYQGENYVVENIRIDFEEGLVDIPIKSMKIHPVENDGDILWIDQNGNTNELIRAIGEAIEDNEM